MSFQDDLRKNLTPELFNEVMDQLGDDFNLDLVPRSRLNNVIKQRNALRDQLAGGSQPQGGKGTRKPANDEDDDDVPVPAAPADKPVDIEALKAQWLKEQGDAVTDVKIQYAALAKLREAKALDPELLWNAGLIDRSKLSLEADGSVKGLDEAIEALTKSHAKQFSTGSGGVPSGTGKSGGDDGFDKITTKEEFLKLPTDKQLAFKQANPEVFKSFLAR